VRQLPRSAPWTALLISFSSDLPHHGLGRRDSAYERASGSARGAASLWDATFAALTFSDETPTIRRLVLVQDGDDTSSWPRDSV
jgi:hypothetical protein